MRHMSRPVFAALLILAAAAVNPLAKPAGPSSSRAGRVVSAGNMNLPRSGHTATRLSDGRVLIAGGMVRNGEFLAEAEIYDPATGKFLPLGRMSTQRVSHTATLLPNGKVLIVGGIAGRYRAEGHWMGEVVASAELFDPATEAFTPTGPLHIARNSHAAVLLPEGKVLIMGGSGGGDWRQLHASAELYDPVTGAFRLTGAMQTPRIPHFAVLLKSGKVLVAGGTGPNRTVLASAEFYEPKTGKFTPAGRMTVVRHKHAAARLADGRVLITGGSDERDWDGQMRTAEIYDPAAARFIAAGEMNFVRFKHGATMVALPSGKILVAGGGERAEIFDPVTGSFVVVDGSLGAPWHFSTAALLVDGEVLIAGGYGNSSEATRQAWLYRP